MIGDGVPGAIRTHDPQIRNLVLYPAELRGRGRRLAGEVIAWPKVFREEPGDCVLRFNLVSDFFSVRAMVRDRVASLLPRPGLDSQPNPAARRMRCELSRLSLIHI